MRVAIINNSDEPPKNIVSLLEGHHSVVFDYSEAKRILQGSFDVIILSGSSQFPIIYNREKLSDEITLIQKTHTPLIGICYGCELIAIAFGGSLKDRGEYSRERAPFPIKVIHNDPIFLGKTDFMAYDAHRWVIDKTPNTLEILAKSVHGPEVIRHRERPLYGFQFHPEKLQDQTFGDEIFHALLQQYAKRSS